MNYDKLSRSIRQYYKKGIIRKPDVSRRLVYQFVNPVWWRGSADLKRMCQGAPKDMLDILYSRGNKNSEARSFDLCIWCLISIVKTAYWTMHSCLSYNIILLYYSQNYFICLLLSLEHLFTPKKIHFKFIFGCDVWFPKRKAYSSSNYGNISNK